MSFFKSVEQTSQNHVKCIPKSAQSRPKIIPTSSQNYTKIIPKSSQNHPKLIPKSSQNYPKVIPKSADPCKVSPNKFAAQLARSAVDSRRSFCALCECSHPGWDPGPPKREGALDPGGPSAPLGPTGAIGMIPKLFRMECFSDTVRSEHRSRRLELGEYGRFGSKPGLALEPIGTFNARFGNIWGLQGKRRIWTMWAKTYSSRIDELGPYLGGGEGGGGRRR